MSAVTDFLVESFIAGAVTLAIAAVFALVGTGRSFGGGTSYTYGQALFSIIFCFVVVILISYLFTREYWAGAQVFGTVVIMPLLAVGIVIVRVYLREWFGRPS